MYTTEFSQKLEELLAIRPNSTAEMLEQIKGRDILLYGAGNVGGQMLGLLRQHGIQPAAFLDKNAVEGKGREGVVVLSPDDDSLSRDFRGSAIVFVCVLLDKAPKLALYEKLKSIGYSHINYAFPWVMIDRNFHGLTSNDHYKVSLNEAFELLEDLCSQNIYTRNLTALFSDEAGDDFIPPSGEIQYFDSTVPVRKANVRFVDCGAFTGDTLESLCSNIKNIDAYAGFEPMPSNMEKFTGTMRAVMDQIATGIIFPCAVGAKNEIVSFADSSSSSRLDKNCGGVCVPVVRLDDTLTAFRPNFIKMDIEGSEIDALEGARKIITQNKPDLAICVYHAIDHYWNIPLLLRSMVCEYKFYLRTYHFGGFETVLYAIA